MSIADRIIERQRAKTGGLADRIISRLRGKDTRLEDAQARAKTAQEESDRLNSFSGLAGETVKGIFGMGKEFGKEFIGSTAAVGADVINTINPLNKLGFTQPIRQVNMFDKEFIAPTERERRAKELFNQGQYKRALGELGTAGLDVVSTFATPFKGLKLLKGGSATKGFIEAGTAAAPIVGAYGAAGAAAEGKSGYDIAKDTAIGTLAGFAGGGILGAALAKIGSKFKGEKSDVDPIEVGKIVDEVDEVMGRASTPVEEEAVMEAVSRGVPREEILKEAAKVSGKAPKVTQETPKSENDDEVFLNSVEERFNASKREKFREATKDEQGRFTGSIKGSLDAERDELARSIENRIQNAKGDGIEEFSYREDLRRIQEKVARAKKDELAGLKEESEKITEVLLDQRAKKIRPEVEKEKKESYLSSIAGDSESPRDFMLNMKRLKLDPKKEFNSLSELENFYKSHGASKYRTITESDMIPKKLADETESGYQVRAEMETATAGSRDIIDYGMDQQLISTSSTFPKWVSPEYRSRELFDKVLNHIQEGTVPKTSKQIGLYKEVKEEMVRRANKFGERFEELTGTKLTPEQETQIKTLHKKMFGDDGVEITAQILTPEGQKAFGVYKNKVIKILDGQADPKDTLYHEAVHKYLDLFTTLDEQKKIYLEARKLWKTDNLEELEEQIAEHFIRYAKTNEGVVGTMKVLFDKVIDRIKSAFKGESEIEKLYKDILTGKAKQTESVKKGLVKPKLEDKTDKKTSLIASRLNEALPEGVKIDETYDPKVIKDEIDNAASTIAKDKNAALEKAFDPNTNAAERDALLIELSELAKKEGDWAAVADLFTKRSEMIRAGAQALNMEKASILLNPQEEYMRRVVNARLGKVKVTNQDIAMATKGLTQTEKVTRLRKRVKSEVTESVKKAFKLEDAQKIFDQLTC